MTIHDDIRAAGERVIDAALAERDAKITELSEALTAAQAERERVTTNLATAERNLAAVTGERDELAVRVEHTNTDVVRLTALVDQLQARIRELEAATPPAPTAPVAGVTERPFQVPADAIIVTPATIVQTLATHPEGAVLAGRGGVYPAGLRFNRPGTFQPYQGEQVVVDGKAAKTFAAVVKAPFKFLGIEFGNFTAPDAGVFEYGVMFPTGSTGSVLELCRFFGFVGGTAGVGRSAVYGFNKGALTVRSCDFGPNGQNHITIANGDGILLERNVMRDANQSGQQMEPVTAAIKVAPGAGGQVWNVSVRDNIIDGAKTAGGVWFDTDVFNAVVFNNDISRCEKIGIMSEATVDTLAISNRVRGSGEAIKAYLAPGMKVWNNDIAGGRLAQVVARQDQRRNKNAATIALGSTWITRGVEVVNNDMDDTYEMFQIDTMDDGPVGTYTPTQSGIDMLSRVEGNRMPRRAGKGTQVGLGTTQRTRDYLTIEQAEARQPGIFRNNANAKPVPLPADIARRIGVPEGTARTGLLVPLPRTA